jgi:NADPH-dependent glutamate synthase beta subunit-like oxidoreductase
MERDDEPGGMLRYCIPQFDLPRSVLDADIGRIVESGVSMETGVSVDFPREIDALLSSGVRAVIVATGAPVGRISLRVPGGVDGALPGVLDAVSFMRAVNTGRAEVAGPVIVEGEGAPAIAAARAAVRLGGSRVTLVVPRPLGDLALPPATLETAQNDGVAVLDGRRIAEVTGEGRAEGVRLVRCGRVRAGGGRSVPRAYEDETTLPCALVVSAGLRDPESDRLADIRGARLTALGTLAVDPATLALGREGLFAAGDAATGPRNVVEAVASGLRAARSALRFLGEGS